MQHAWVGPNYGAPSNSVSGLKILMVGESHYGKGAEIGTSVPEITREVVTKYQSGEWSIPLLTKVISVTTGRPASETGYRGVRDAWNDLAFYNYVPVLVAEGPRAFESRFWSLGASEFEAVLDDLQPDMIIALGYRLWDNALHRHASEVTTSTSTHSALIRWKAKTVPTLRVMHPSSPRFSGVRLHPQFLEIAASAKRLKAA